MSKAIKKGGFEVQPLETSRHNCKGWDTFAIRAGNNICLAVVGEVDRYYEEEYGEIAKLFAAAPDLLKALKVFIALDGDKEGIEHSRCRSVDCDLCKAFIQAKEAVAKT